jgi:hypothetical protein
MHGKANPDNIVTRAFLLSFTKVFFVEVSMRTKIPILILTTFFPQLSALEHQMPRHLEFAGKSKFIKALVGASGVNLQCYRIVRSHLWLFRYPFVQPRLYFNVHLPE